MSDYKVWDVFVQYEPQTEAHRQMIRTIQLNRLASGICEECGEEVQVDILKDYIHIHQLTHDMHTDRLFHLLDLVLTYRRMLLGFTIDREWSICCECQNTEQNCTSLSEDEIPF